MKNYLVNSPVLLIFYNRSDKTKNLLDNLIRTGFNFSKIYIRVDGPKDEKDNLNVQKVISIIKIYQAKLNIVDLKLEKKNLGLQKNIIKSIDHVLSIEETVIILEDDQLASKEFFQFCDIMLERYNNNSNIFQISGSCYLPEKLKKNDYYYSKFPDCVGWATWRRSWKKLIRNISFSKIITDRVVYKYYQNNSITHWFYEYLYREHVAKPKKGLWSTWWQMTIIDQNGLSINPMKNLVIHDGLDQNTNPEHYDDRYLEKKKITCEKISLNKIEFKHRNYNAKLDYYNFVMIKKTDPIFKIKNRLLWLIRFYFRYLNLKGINKNL